jgi:hypothetical protein
MRIDGKGFLKEFRVPKLFYSPSEYGRDLAKWAKVSFCRLNINIPFTARHLPNGFRAIETFL